MSIFVEGPIGPHKLGVRQILADPVLFLAFGFGAGLVRFAPGTFGTLAALPLYGLALQTGPIGYGLLTLACLVGGVWICGAAAAKLGEHDFSGIVWDEIAGLLVTLWWAPAGWTTLLAGFALFRLYDILKPWPINWLDLKVKGGLGIMLDDLAAGLLAAASLHALLAAGIITAG